MEKIAMRCTKEQYESIKEFIGELYNPSEGDFKDHNYLSNWSDNICQMISSGSITRKVYQTFDKDIFLKACGIDANKFLFDKLKEYFKDAEKCVSLLGTNFNMKDYDLDKLKIDKEFVYTVGGITIFNLNSGEYAKIVTTKQTLTKETLRELTEPKPKELTRKQIEAILGYEIKII